MAQKFGEEFARDWITRGPREIGGFFFPDSNIAQPMYPLRGNYGLSKESDSKEKTEKSFEELHPVSVGRDDAERDDRDRGMERE